MSDIAIRAENLSKRYRIGEHEPYKALRDTLSDAIYAPFRRLSSLFGNSQFAIRNSQSNNTIWALKDVSFEVKQRDVIGIIGRNGAGKSTLLKILCRITEPTEGIAEIHGRVGSLLEVGTGFHAELTGRENIYLNGAILGMKKAEIDRKFDEIVAFAEIEKFIDTPVKHYSSGMYVRLAFAVAAHLEPEILLVDEVLAVGDAQFQKRCLGKMQDIGHVGRTVLFVSHNMSAVRQLCRWGILLDTGRIVHIGDIDEVIDVYMNAVVRFENEKVFVERPNAIAYFNRVCLRNPKGEKVSRFSNDEDITIELEYTVNQTSRYDHLFLHIYRADGVLILKASDDDRDRPNELIRAPGKYVSRFLFPGGILNEGTYYVGFGIGTRGGVFHDSQGEHYFEIVDDTDYTESCIGQRSGVLLLPVEWSEEKIE